MSALGTTRRRGNCEYGQSGCRIGTAFLRHFASLHLLGPGKQWIIPLSVASLRPRDLILTDGTACLNVPA